jgi:hypothetical protein
MTEVKVPRNTRFGSSTMPASTGHPAISLLPSRLPKKMSMEISSTRLHPV